MELQAAETCAPWGDTASYNPVRPSPTPPPIRQAGRSLSGGPAESRWAVRHGGDVDSKMVLLDEPTAALGVVCRHGQCLT